MNVDDTIRQLNIDLEKLEEEVINKYNLIYFLTEYKSLSKRLDINIK